jgi:hypothetical protein
MLSAPFTTATPWMCTRIRLTRIREAGGSCARAI